MFGLGDNLRRAVAWVLVLNLFYFAVEFTAALYLGSVSLFADSIDFLEDSFINLLILIGLSWSATRRAMLGQLLAAIILVPGIATLWQAWEKFNLPIAPDAVPLSLVGAGAFAVNLACALILMRYRDEAGSLTRAAFLSARNDVLANVAIVGAGIATAFTMSAWPDVIVGLGIAVLNADAARDVFRAARSEASPRS